VLTFESRSRKTIAITKSQPESNGNVVSELKIYILGCNLVRKEKSEFPLIQSVTKTT
jgi:hypothetical protein